MNMADEFHQGINHELQQAQQAQEQLQIHAGQMGAQEQNIPNQEGHQLHNQHMQIGMALIPYDHWNTVHKSVAEDFKLRKSLQMWERLTSKGNADNIMIQIPTSIWKEWLTSIGTVVLKFVGPKGFRQV